MLILDIAINSYLQLSSTTKISVNILFFDKLKPNVTILISVNYCTRFLWNNQHFYKK